MSEEIHSPCNLCGQDNARLLFERTAPNGNSNNYALITTDVYSDYGRIVRCRECGLVYRNPRPQPKNILAAYIAAEDQDYLEEQDCRSMNAHLSLRVIRRHKRRGQLLEVGCATGLFLNAARTDFQVKGVEPSSWAAEKAKSQLDLFVYHDSIENLPASEGPFDVIALIDVIEHLPDPAGTLKKAAALLKPGGLLYIVTPDIESFSAKLLRGYWWGLRSAHLFYFSELTLSRMLENAGFEIREKRSYGRIFTYGYWLSRLRKYPSWIYQPICLFVSMFGIQDKVVYINTRDSMEICALQRAP